MSQSAALLAEKDKNAKAWKTAFFVVAIIASMVTLNNYKLREVQRIYNSPDLSNGGMLQVGKVDESYVYFFAYNVFNGISRWRKDGQIEYKQNIDAYQGYTSAHFRSQLSADYAKRESVSRGKINELKGRTREISLIKLGNSKAMVRKRSDSLFTVYLDVYDTERINGSIVSDGAYRYVLNVAIDSADININETGLKVVGFESEPILISN